MIEYDRYLSRAAVQMKESEIRKMGAVGTRIPDLVSFAPGSPAPELFPWAGLQEIAARLLASREPGVLQYGGTRGYRPLVESLVQEMAARGIRSTPEETIVTTGSQQGIDLLGRVLIDPGDTMLVELPAYAGAITAFRNAQARLVGVRQEADGVDLEHLDLVVQRERAARHRIAGYFDEASGPSETRPIKAGDLDGRVVYLRSFSKTLAPGLRVAWLTAPSAIAAKVETVKQAADLCTGVLDQRIVHEALAAGIVTSGLPELRRRYREKRDAMERALGEELGHFLTWPPARGGFFLWARLPSGLDADRLLNRALAARVSYVTGSAFFVDELDPRLIRLSFSAPAIERIAEGVRRLASAIRDELADTATTSS
jgi:2-aminoadipate transaminase